MQLTRGRNEKPFRRLVLIRECETYEQYMGDSREEHLIRADGFNHGAYEKALALQRDILRLFRNDIGPADENVAKLTKVCEKPVEVVVHYSGYPSYRVAFTVDEVKKLLDKLK